ncbi:MAG: hypothetical protein ACOY37_11325 [Pseudomonadota bacterium]
MNQVVLCPICIESPSRHYSTIDGYDYFACETCGSLHIDPAVIARMDLGGSVVGGYADEYWEQERRAAADRAAGLSLCRAGEAILYCRRPVRRFLDVGSGPNYLASNLQHLIDPDEEIVHSVEKFPPPYAKRHPNFHIGEVGSLHGTFDAGVCIEVVEHLTPSMLAGVAAGLAKVSAPGSYWLFNTGMPGYVLNEDPAYMDPTRRGHIVSYSLAAVERIFSPLGFRVGTLPGKSFAFFAEYQPVEELDFDRRIYAPVAENAALLKRNGLLFHAAFETARSYLYYSGYMERTAWALALDGELHALRATYSEKPETIDPNGV